MMYKKIEKALDQLDYFTQKSWKVINYIIMISLMCIPGSGLMRIPFNFCLS